MNLKFTKSEVFDMSSGKSVIIKDALPCPFCGKKPKFIYSRDEYRTEIFKLKCNNCEVHFECKYEILNQPPIIEIVKELVNKWNKRK